MYSFSLLLDIYDHHRCLETGRDWNDLPRHGFMVETDDVVLEYVQKKLKKEKET